MPETRPVPVARRRDLDKSTTPSERRVPSAPRNLSKTARKVWRLALRTMPLLAECDLQTVERYCELVDEREAIREEVSRRGLLLSEPIVTPLGEVVGERVVPNPAVAMLRALEREMDGLLDRLALVPAARARLGLTLTTAERTALEVDRVLAGKYREEPEK